MKIRIVPLAFALAVLGVGAPVALSQNSPAPQKAALPKVSEVEQLKLENLTLKAQALEQQLQDLNRQYSQLVAQINVEHPGYTFNPASNSFAPVPAQLPAKEPKK